MNVLKRASTTIFRQPVKAVILLVLIFILSTTLLGSITMTRAMNNTDLALRHRMSPIVTLQIDQDNIPFELTADGGMTFTLPDSLTSEIIQQISELPYVNRHYYSRHTQLYTYDYDYYFAPYAHHSFNAGVQLSLGNGRSIWLQQGNFFQFYGTSDDEPIAMQEGVIELVAGETFENFSVQSETDLFPALISSSLAAENELHVGSTFTMEYEFLILYFFDWDAENPRIDENVLWYFPYEFEIVGLFDVVPTDNIIPRGYEHMEGQRVSDLSNRIHVPNEVLTIIQTNTLAEYQRLYDDYGLEWWPLEQANEDIIDFQSFFILNDPLELESFREAALEILPDFWIVDDLLNTFANVSASFDSIRSIANSILWISASATILILTLFILLFLRDRRHEIGVYLALGESRRKIITQILIEVVVVGFIGMTLSIFAGQLISGAVSRQMLRSEFAHQPSYIYTMTEGSWGQNDTLFHMGFGSELTIEQTLELFDQSLTTGIILPLYSAGLGVIVLSTVIPVFYVAKSNPKKILMQGRIQ
ncbi:MAG: ABC transporter permease [Turicibacter sp.]|nr:ABC transporter permease [Turicibacter sp.]